MIQLVQPDLSVGDQIGWCLRYAAKVYHCKGTQPYAWNAWQATKYKHSTAEPMPNISIPVWFSYMNQGINMGHVVVWVPGQGFYSSPWKQGTTHAVLPSIAEVERIYGAKYVGWSEDILELRVAEGGSMATDKEIDDTINGLHIIAFGQHASDATFNNQRPLFKNNYVSGVLTVITNYSNDPRHSMTQDSATKLVSKSYRGTVDTDPTNDQASYWIERIMNDPNTAWELPVALGADSYNNTPDFRNKGHNYDKDVKSAYEKGQAEAGGGDYEPYDFPPLFTKKEK